MARSLAQTILRTPLGIIRWARISRATNVPLAARIRLAAKIAPITIKLWPSKLPAHTDRELYVFIDAVLKRQNIPGVIVEAGAYKGISSAKLSHVAEMMGKQLFVFDSFEGLPANSEEHETSTRGHSIQGWFSEGNYFGSLDEVKENVERFGRPEVVTYVPGWFADTMPDFERPIAAAYLDVDLAESTRTCIKYLWPRIVSGGVMVSQDGDFPLVIQAIEDDSFWLDEVGCPPPKADGIGTSKMVTFFKE